MLLAFILLKFLVLYVVVLKVRTVRQVNWIQMQAVRYVTLDLIYFCKILLSCDIAVECWCQIKVTLEDCSAVTDLCILHMSLYSPCSRTITVCVCYVSCGPPLLCRPFSVQSSTCAALCKLCRGHHANLLTWSSAVLSKRWALESNIAQLRVNEFACWSSIISFVFFTIWNAINKLWAHERQLLCVCEALLSTALTCYLSH